jgi:hypothetical protein
MPIPSLRHCLLVAGCALLAACQLGPTSDSHYKRITWEHKQPGCSGETCPLLNIDTLHFADEPQLNAAIEQGLLQMTGHADDAPPAQSLLTYQRDYLHTAELGWANYLQAKVREQHGPLIIVELSSYVQTGGAHGMPGRRFINYDRVQNRVLTLDDLLLPGQEQAFWRQAEQAHAAWLKSQQLDKNPEYLTTWPFQPDAHVALLRDRLLLKYDVYAIAPYSSGHPEIGIDYSALKGIVRPEWLP